MSKRGEADRPWWLTRLKGIYQLTYLENGDRRRHTLKTADEGEAYLIAPAIYANLNRPTGKTVKDLWSAYTMAKDGKAVLVTMAHTWKALEARFGHRDGDGITLEDCREHTLERRKNGIKDGTIHTELGHLRTVLKWAENHRMIDRAPAVERPSKPEPKDRYLTREEAHRMIAAAKMPHLKLAFHLMLATAARVAAVLELKWERVDFERRLIYLRNPDDTVKRKGRAVVPINKTLMSVLRDAKKGARTGYVIEWAGEPVKSLKKGIATAAKAAGLENVSAHVFRHTAAVWMAEGGVTMEEISQYLGHNNVAITRKVYARYSPDYLRKAADVLELGLYVVPSGQAEPEKRNEK